MDNRAESKCLSSFGSSLEGHLGGPFDPKAESRLFRKDNFQTVTPSQKTKISSYQANKGTSLPAFIDDSSRA
jgi:hypothetical protein